MEMNAPVGSNALDVGARGVVGKPLDRVDGRLKVTGGARYAYEVEQGPKTAYGYVVEASIGKGQIKSIDTDMAERAPGVVLVLTSRNAPQQGTGNHHVAHPVLTSAAVQYYGVPVAFVVAETFEQARAAAYLVRVNYERSPGRFALRSGLDQARAPHSQIRPPPDSAVGDFTGAFAAAPVQLDVTYTTPLQSQAMMEPHATLAMWEDDNLILHTSNQMLNQGRDAVARTLKIPVEKVRLISPFIGGGFGSKLWVNADAILAAIAARQLNRPVKTALTRQQVFHVTTHHSAHPPGDRSKRPHSCDRPRCVFGQFVERADLRGRRPPNADALCRRQPADQASPRSSGHSCRFVDARPRRGDRSSGAGMCDGRTRREARPRSDRVEDAQRADAGSGKPHSLFQPSPNPLLPGRSAPVWLGPAESKARPVAGRALARRNGRGGRHAREPS